MTTKTDPKFQSLLALMGSEERAITAWNSRYPDSPIKSKAKAKAKKKAVDPEIQKLVDAGFTKAEAVEFIAEAKGDPAPVEAEKPLTSQEQGMIFAAQQGFTPTRGRVYSNTALIEAQVRVLKSGKAEVVRLSGERHIKAVLVFRVDDGFTVACQNLSEPS